MRRRWLVLLAALSFPAVAFGAGSGAPAASTAPEGGHDPNNVRSLSEAMEAIVDGNGKYVAKDLPAALESYEKAIKLQPKNPLAHYGLGEVYLAMANLAAAENAWKEADAVGDAAPAVKLKVLFALADVRERMKQWDDAKLAWQRYADYAGKHPEVTAFPPSAAARIQAIDDSVKQDKAYDVVRERIAAEKARAGAPKK